MKKLRGVTSCAVVRRGLEEVKGGRGPVLHWEELADPAGRRGLDPSHLAVQGRLEVAALTPQQGGDVPGENYHKPLSRSPPMIPSVPAHHISYYR